MLGYACTRMVQIAINCYYSYDKQMLGRVFNRPLHSSVEMRPLLTSIEDVVPARPGVGAGLTVGFARIGSFACPHEAVAGAFVGHRLVRFAGGFISSLVSGMVASIRASLPA